MRTPVGPAAIPLLVRGHAQDAAFLFVQRAGRIDGPSFGEADVGRRDQRIEANIEGLAASGPLGREVAREEALAVGGPGEWFALAALALETGEAALLREALELGLAAGAAGERGLSGAVAWTEPAQLGGEVRRWVASAESGLRRLGLAALSHHRVDPGGRLAAALDDPDPGVRGRAARLAGEVGRTDALPLLRERLAEGVWPAWAAARMGDRRGAEALLAWVQANPGEMRAAMALDMALIAFGPGAKAAATRLLGRPETYLLGLSRLGVVGDRAVLPWLIDRMREPVAVEAAGLAFRDLFPVEVDDVGLFTESPATLGPAFAPLDPAPLPIADRIADWAPDPAAAPFVSQRARMLSALREGLAAPQGRLATWRHRRRGNAAWV